ncbi:MAG: glycosyltransferase family 2 protein [Proteobacteria bacterium]|nr:glycosyltransferase family 2 protein [Pseudomonadota bacterium]
MADKPSISIIVPCYNEAGNIEGTVESIKSALDSSARFGEAEIIIFNDLSTDSTGEVIDSIAEKEKSVRTVHNERNMGFGYNYTEGVRLAKMEYIIMVPGDNEIPSEAIRRVFVQTGNADLVIPYTANTHVRPLSRRFISRAFVILMNTLFGLRLKYYNGTCVLKAKELKQLELKTWGFAYMASILVRLIRQNASYVEVGIDISQRETGASQAFTMKNIVSVVSAIVGLFIEVRLTDRALYSKVGAGQS